MMSGMDESAQFNAQLEDAVAARGEDIEDAWAKPRAVAARIEAGLD